MFQQYGGSFQLNPLVTTCRMVNQSNSTIQTNLIRITNSLIEHFKNNVKLHNLALGHVN